MLDQLVEISSVTVFASIAALQLYLMLTTTKAHGFDEGNVQIIQYAIGIPTFAGLIVFMLDPDVATAIILPIPATLRLGGIILFLASAFLVFWAHTSLGRFWSVDLETKVDHALVDTGPYRLVRHPIYTAFFGLAAGLFMMTGNWPLGLSMITYFASVAARARREEQMLMERLGDIYRFYVLRTGRFLPSYVSLSLTPDLRDH